MTLTSLRRAVSFSLQDTSLLSGTVRANMLLAKPDATDEEIDHTLADLGGLEIVRRLPAGLDTEVGPSGGHLSPGRARSSRWGGRSWPTRRSSSSTSSRRGWTSMARGGPARRRWSACSRGAPASSSPTVCGMVRRADHIVVLEQGRVIEQGDHDDALMRAGGAYASLQAESRRLRVQAA